MALSEDRDLVPLGTGFDLVKRGYSRTQVEEHLERLDGDLRLLAADRDAAVSQAGELARQLEVARSEIDECNQQIERLSQPPTTVEGLSERLQRMLRMAQDEAAETRARAEAEAGHIRSRAEADANALRARYEQLIADLDTRRAEMEAEHEDVISKAKKQAEQIVADGEAARKQADDEAEAARAQVEEDFDIAMAARRTESMRELAEEEANSKAEAERRVREAGEEAAATRAQIAEEERTSTADAERRVREATDEARRRLEEATAEAHRRVGEATEEANRRIDEAGDRVETLRSVRTRVAEQLAGARELLAQATPDLDELPEERAAGDRPEFAEFRAGGRGHGVATQSWQDNGAGRPHPEADRHDQEGLSTEQAPGGPAGRHEDTDPAGRPINPEPAEPGQADAEGRHEAGEAAVEATVEDLEQDRETERLRAPGELDQRGA